MTKTKPMWTNRWTGSSPSWTLTRRGRGSGYGRREWRCVRNGGHNTMYRRKVWNSDGFCIPQVYGRRSMLPSHLHDVMGSANLSLARGDYEAAVKLCNEVIRQGNLVLHWGIGCIHYRKCICSKPLTLWSHSWRWQRCMRTEEKWRSLFRSLDVELESEPV